jgi:hypothetical protein
MPRDEAYQKAEKQIEEARRSKASQLDLSGSVTNALFVSIEMGTVSR